MDVDDERAAAAADGRGRSRAVPRGPSCVIVTGMSGAGRSTAAKVLEDLGWYVVDNLPPQLHRRRWPSSADAGPRRASASSRSWSTCAAGAFFTDLPRGARRRCATRGVAPAGALPRGHRRGAGPPVRERAPAAPAAGRAAGCSTASPRERDAAAATCAPRPTWSSTPPASTCTSSPARSTPLFGGEDGPALRVDGDVVRLQVRPAARRRLRRRHALPAQPVLGARAAPAHRPGRRGRATTCWARTGADEFLDAYVDAAASRSPTGYLREGKRYLTVAVGCTGGKHRSVAMAEELAAPAARRRASTPAPCTATWGGSECRRATDACGSSPSAAATACTPSLRRAAATSPTRPDRGGDRRRRRRLLAAGCAREFGVLPPGDLRMALAALCGDDDWGRTWARRPPAPLRRRRRRWPATRSATC